MVFTYFCRQVNDTPSGMVAEDWGYIDTDNGNRLMTDETTSNVTVRFEEGEDEGKGGCFGTGVGKLRFSEATFLLPIEAFIKESQLYEMRLEVEKETTVIRIASVSLQIMVEKGIPPIMEIA